MKNLLYLISASAFICSCGGSSIPQKASVAHHSEGAYELKLDAEKLQELNLALIQARENYKRAATINGRLVNVRWSNERNLNGYRIEISYHKGQICGYLYKNKPFILSSPGREYNFKHLLSKEEIAELYRLIPEWKK